jgi:hypothetical protein
MSGRGITINALAIGTDTAGSHDQRQTELAELSAYFRAEVILGPDSFVQTALGFDAYAEAMTQKLKREMEGEVIGALQ